MNLIESLFPRLRSAAYQITSPRDGIYNCIAWAVGDTTRWWWPDAAGQEFWPDGVPRQETVEAFLAAFATLGFDPGASVLLEEGVEKIALYANAAGQPKHATRQLASGRWTSKLGQAEDIEHDLHDLTGDVYGSVAYLLKRPRTAMPPGEATQGEQGA
jgi:hypothetical protein